MNKLRILLVDADSDRLEQFSGRLEEAEHTVLPVGSLQEAEEALFVLKIDVAIFGSFFGDAETEIFVDRLRGIENTQKNALRAPVFALSESLEDAAAWTLEADRIFDGRLAASFDSATLATAIEGVRMARTAERGGPTDPSLADLPIFEPLKFRQQVANDPELTVEIIDLFLQERSVEIPEMQAALEREDFRPLADMAHTMKGSLSSLHAALARHHAQELETAAKGRDETACRRSLRTLAEDLDRLEPLLLKLRDETKAL